MNTILPIKTALCAYGMSGRVFHAPFLHCMPQFSFYAVTERNRKKAVEKYPSVKTFPSVTEMLADDEIELVVVNTPNATHFSYAQMALKAGKHVIVEKPFTITVQQAIELIALAKKAGKQLIVFQNRRWDSDFQVVKQVVQEQLLGKLIEAEFHFDRYKIAQSPKKHKEQATQGNGVLFDLGAHIIDQAVHLFGQPNAVFSRVQKHRPASEIEDYFALQLLYPNFNCTLKSSLLVREPNPAYVLHGVEGSFHKSRADVQEANLEAGISPCSPDWGKESETESGLLHHMENGLAVRKHLPTPQGDYASFFTGVFEAIRLQKTSPVPLNEVLTTMKIIEAALESQDKTEVVFLD